MEYKCPFPESTPYTCDRKAIYLVHGTAICDYHALKLAIRVNDQGQIVAAPLTTKT